MLLCAQNIHLLPRRECLNFDLICEIITMVARNCQGFQNAYKVANIHLISPRREFLNFDLICEIITGC